MASIIDNLDAVFVENLGDLVTVYPYGQSSRSVYAIFENRESFELNISEASPMLHFRKSDISDLRDGDRVILANGDKYLVRTPKADGRGMVSWILEEED